MSPFRGAHDHTSLNTLRGCEQEYVYEHVQGLRGEFDEPALVFGAAVHAGTKVLYTPGASIDDVTLAVTTAWGTPNFAPPKPGTKKKEFRTLEYAIMLVGAYASQRFPADLPFVVEQNEQYLRFGDEDAIVDRIVRAKSDGLLYTMETKTTGLWMSPAWYDQWEHSAQLAQQIDIAEGALGIEIAGAFVDAIYVSSRGFPEVDDFSIYGPIKYSPELRAELRAERDFRKTRATELHNHPDFPVKNPRNCFRFNKMCPFTKYCKAQPEDRTSKIELDLAVGVLRERRWDPSTRDP